MASYASCKHLPVEGVSSFTTCTSSSALHLCPPRYRRCRRVLYPAGQRRRAPLKEAPDQARRWLLLLSALVLMQIYNEETQTCTAQELQGPDQAVCQVQENEGNLSPIQALVREEPFRVQTVGTAPENQPQCVVA